MGQVVVGGGGITAAKGRSENTEEGYVLVGSLAEFGGALVFAEGEEQQR